MAVVSQPLRSVRILSNPVRRNGVVGRKAPVRDRCGGEQQSASALPSAELIAQLSEVGDVEAPTWVIFAVYVACSFGVLRAAGQCFPAADEHKIDHLKPHATNVIKPALNCLSICRAAAVTVVGAAIIPLALKGGMYLSLHAATAQAVRTSLWHNSSAQKHLFAGTEAAEEMQARDSEKWGGK